MSSNIDPEKTLHHEHEGRHHKAPKQRGHCKKFWWAWLVGVLVVILVVLLVVCVASPPAATMRIVC